MTDGGIYIVGGHGYLGAVVTKSLVDRRTNVVVISRSGDTRDGVASAPFAKLHKLIRKDPDPCIVWLLAGDRHREPDLLEQLHHALPDGHRTRLVYGSSCAIYGDCDTPCSESFDIRPRNPYAKVKAITDELARKLFPSATVLRLGTLHGHTRAAGYKQAIHRMLRQAATEGVVHLFSGQAWRPFVERAEAAEAVARAALDTAVTGVYNIARDHATFADVARYAAGIFGATIKHVDQLSDDNSYRVAFDKALGMGLLDTKPEIDLWLSMDMFAGHLATEPGAHGLLQSAIRKS